MSTCCLFSAFFFQHLAGFWLKASASCRCITARYQVEISFLCMFNHHMLVAEKADSQLAKQKTFKNFNHVILFLWENRVLCNNLKCSRAVTTCGSPVGAAGNTTKLPHALQRFLACRTTARPPQWLYCVKRHLACSLHFLSLQKVMPTRSECIHLYLSLFCAEAN